MTALPLPDSFASQSPIVADVAVTRSARLGRILSLLVEAPAYPRRGTIRVDGLMPKRHYRLDGTGERFCRADGQGVAQVNVVLTGPTLVMLGPLL